jgi:hypothetical protein
MVEISYTYTDILKDLDLSYNALAQQLKRGYWDPADPKSLAMLYARHGKIKVKETILRHMLTVGGAGKDLGTGQREPRKTRTRGPVAPRKAAK